MKPTTVHRVVFSKDEVFAALLPQPIACSYAEIRVEGDEVVLDFVNPLSIAAVAAKMDEAIAKEPAAQPEPDVEEQQPAPAAEEPLTHTKGPNELEAEELCARKAFHTFLEVKTNEAAAHVLLERTHATHFAEFDSVRSWKQNFRDVVAEFEAWMME